MLFSPSSLSLSRILCRYQKSQKNKHFSCVTMLMFIKLYSAFNGCWKCSIMLHFLSIKNEEFPLINLSQGESGIEWDKINFSNYTFFLKHCQHSTICRERQKKSYLSASGKHKCLLQLLTHIRGRFIGLRNVFYFWIYWRGSCVRFFLCVNLLITKFI